MKQYAKVEDLINDVRKIDSAAADYISNDAQKDFYWIWEGDDNDLSTAFNWGASPQGRDYWIKIYHLLGGTCL